MKRLLFVPLFLVSLPALAQEAVAPLISSEAMARLVSAGTELFIALLLLGAGVVVVKLKLSDDRKKLLGGGIDLAYGVVAELARRTPNTIDDKAAVALKELAVFFKASGKSEPTEAEKVIALQAFSAKHAAEKLVASSPK